MISPTRFSLPTQLPRWPSHDPFLLLLTFILPLGGVMLVASARIPSVLHGQSLFERVTVLQMGFAAAGVALALGISAIDYHKYRRWAPLLLVPFWILLIAVLFVADTTSEFGARRWFRVGDLTIQPSEFTKIFFIGAIAALAHIYGAKIRSWRYSIARLGGIVGLVVIPIILEPDLGTALMTAFVGGVMIFAAGARLQHLGIAIIALLPIGLASIYQNPYQWTRLNTFLRGDPDLTKTGYQADQARIAMGWGGITGRGLGEGTQKFRLPVPDSDAIFAVLGEEFGLIGTSLVAVLFLALFVRGIQIAFASQDVFGRLLAVGIVTQLCGQAFINMAVITSLVPVTGIPLPFISRGGSSLLASLILLGILMNIARNNALRQRM